VLAERRRQRRAVTPTRVNVRHVKFTPEEMAIDAADVDMSKPTGYVRLDPELRHAFPNDKAVNDALKKVVELSRIPAASSRSKKSA
jgi:hypothetical protein